MSKLHDAHSWGCRSASRPRFLVNSRIRASMNSNFISQHVNLGSHGKQARKRAVLRASTLLAVLAMFPSFAFATTQTYQNNTLGNGADNGSINRQITVGPTDFPAGEVIFSVVASVGFAKIDDAGVGVGRCNPILDGPGSVFNTQASQTLTSPAATVVNLFTPGTYTGTITHGGTVLVNFDQTAGSVVGGVAPQSGTFRPTGNLNSYDGQNPAGNWTLTLSDNAVNDPHCFSSLSLTIRTLSVPGIPDLVTADDNGLSNTDNITNEDDPQFTVTCDPGATVQLRENGGTIATATCNGSGVATLTTSNLPDGIHLISAREIDGANVTAESTALQVEIDTVAPNTLTTPDMQATSDSGISSTDNITNITTPTFDILNCVDGLVVQLREGNTVHGSAVCSGGAAVITSNALGSGAHNLDARQTDVAGNNSVDSGTLAVTIDFTAPGTPGTPNLQAASDTGTSSFDEITFDNSPTFTVSCTSGTTVTLLLDGSPVATNTCTGGSSTITVPFVADGSFGFSAYQTDTAGNTGNTSGSLPVTIDTVAPVATVAPDLQATSDSGNSDSDNLTNDSTPTFDLICDNSDFVDLLENGFVRGSGDCSGGNPVAVTSSFMSDGIHSLQARQRDIAGNVSSDSGSLDVTIDTQVAATNAPDLLDDSGISSTDNVTNIDAPNFLVTSCDPGALVVLFDGGTPVGFNTCDLSGETTILSSALIDGPHTLTVQQTDTAGNLSSSSAGLNVVIDTGVPTAPALPDLIDDSGISTIDNITNFSTPTVRVGCTTGLVRLFEDSTELGSTNCAGGNAFIVTSTLSDGQHFLYANQTDTAGNVGQNGPTLSITVDTVAPTGVGIPDLQVGSDTGILTDDNLTFVQTPTFDVACSEEGILVEIYEQTNLLGSGFCAGGTVAVTSITLVDGPYNITAREIDVAGNAGTESDPLAITIDTVPPAQTGDPDLQAGSDTGSDDTDNLTGDNTPTFDVSCTDDGDTIELVEGTDVIGSALCAGNTAAITTTAALSDGLHTVFARAEDPAGNEGPASGTLDVTIDTSADGSSGIPDLLAADDSGSSSIDNITNVNEPEFTVSCTVDGNLVQLVEDTTVLGSAVCSSGTVTIESDTLADGSHDIASNQIDDLGNVSANSATLTVVIDTAAPTVPVIVVPAEGEVVGTDTPDFSGTGEVAATVTVFQGLTNLGSSPVSGGGAWSFTTAVSLPDGLTTVTAQAVDVAGNSSAQSSARNFTVDDDSDGDGLRNSEEGGLTDDADGDGLVNALDFDSHASSVISTEYSVPWNGFNDQVSIGEGRNNLGNKTILIRVTMRDRDGENHEVFPMFVPPNGQADVNLNALDGFNEDDYGTALFEGFEVDGVTPLSPGDFDGQVSVYRLEGPTFDDFDYAYAIPFSGYRRGTLAASFNTNHPSLDPADAGFRVANFGEMSNNEAIAISGNLFFFGQNGAPIEIDPVLNPGVFARPVFLSALGREDVSIHDIVGVNRIGLVLWVPNPGFELARVSMRVNRYFFRSTTFGTTGANAFAGVVSVEGMRGRSGPIVLPMDTSSVTTAIGEVSNVLAIPINIIVRAFDKDGVLKDTISQTLGARATLHDIGDPFLNSNVGHFTVSSDVPGALYATIVHYSRLPTATVWSARSLRGSDPLGKAIFGSLNSFLSQSCRVVISNSGSTPEMVDLTRFDFNGLPVGSALEIPLAANGSASSNICSGFPSNTYGKFQIVPRNRQAKISAGATRDQIDYNMATEVRG